MLLLWWLKFFPSSPIGGDLVSTGGMRRRLHVRDAVGPWKNGKNI